MTYGRKNSTIISSIRIARKSGKSPLRGIHNPLTKAPKKACIPIENEIFNKKNIQRTVVFTKK